MNIVLVHGMGGTARTWELVAPRLREGGHRVAVVENAMASLRGDVERTLEAVEDLGGPVVLVGHSYGGAVITNAGNHPEAVALVYVAAFGPDEGETVQRIVETAPAAEGSAYMRRSAEGAWMTDFRDGYWEAVAWDLTPEQRESVLRETRWTGPAVFTEVTEEPAWRNLPTWYMIAEDDRTLRPELQQRMAERMGATVVRVPGSHYVTRVHVEPVVELIEQAAAVAA